MWSGLPPEDTSLDLEGPGVLTANKASEKLPDGHGFPLWCAHCPPQATCFGRVWVKGALGDSETILWGARVVAAGRGDG